MEAFDAWVLPSGRGRPGGPAQLVRDVFTHASCDEDEALVEPIDGCWEANMTHALLRSPVDVAPLRGQDRLNPL